MGAKACHTWTIPSHILRMMPNGAGLKAFALSLKGLPRSFGNEDFDWKDRRVSKSFR